MNTTNPNHERPVTVQSGWVWLAINLILQFGSIALLIYSLVSGVREQQHPYWGLLIASLVGIIPSVFIWQGFFTLQPNQARVLVLFGRYQGTVRESGFHWGNPFYTNGPANRAAFFAALAHAGKSEGQAARALAAPGATGRRNKI